MNYENKILIGGQALKSLGSPRHTDDADYLVFDENKFDLFVFDEENNIDYMNGNSSNFFEEIYNKEKNNEVASVQSLFDLKAFSLLSHIRNFNKNKINDTVFDLNFLKINFGVDSLKTLKKYITPTEAEEIFNFIK